MFGRQAENLSQQDEGRVSSSTNGKRCIKVVVVEPLVHLLALEGSLYIALGVTVEPLHSRNNMCERRLLWFNNGWLGLALSDRNARCG
jgi:hypothetical protein